MAESELSPFEQGVLIGVLIGEGHFGGDGRQPQVTVRMHTRHERLFRWLETHVAGSKLYGPYEHGGRSYYQWMARGPALREIIGPFVAGHLAELDDYAAGRFTEMCDRYGLSFTGPVPVSPSGSP